MIIKKFPVSSSMTLSVMGITRDICLWEYLYVTRTFEIYSIQNNSSDFKG